MKYLLTVIGLGLVFLAQGFNENEAALAFGVFTIGAVLMLIADKLNLKEKI